MNDSCKGKKVAILVADGFEESELQKPLQALKDAGAEPSIVSPKSGEVKGWKEKEAHPGFRWLKKREF